jgi:hypothetical protein
MKIFKRFAVYFGITLLLACQQTKQLESVASDNIAAPQDDAYHGAANDSVSFIGFVYQFEETGELYTDLYFRDTFTYTSCDSIAALKDTLVFSNSEMTRFAFPGNAAKKIFDHSGLNDLEIFNARNEKVASASIRRTELIEDMIESYFIALIEPDQRGVLSEVSYCIGNRKWPMENLIAARIDSDSLDRIVGRLTGYTDGAPENVAHYSAGKIKGYYSVINHMKTTTIIYSTPTGSTTLYHAEGETILKTVFIPKTHHGQPILLIRAGAPETDMLWTAVLIFDGTTYRTAPRGRVNLFDTER